MAMKDRADNLTENQLAAYLNEEFRKAVVPITSFVGLEIVLGFFGNLTVLYVFLFQYHVCNFRYFVLSLSFVDILSTLTTMPAEIVTLLNWYMFNLRGMCKVKSFLNMFMALAEIFCLLIIAFDRYRKVCNPFKWQIKPRTSITICCAIYVVSFVLSVPMLFLWGLQSHNVSYRNRLINVTVCEKDERFKNTIYPLVFSSSVVTIMSVCLLVMLGLYILVATKLVKESRKHKISGSPMVVVTPPDTDTVPPADTVGSVSGLSDTGCSSIPYKETIDIKKDGAAASTDGESDIQNTDESVNVPNKKSRNGRSVENFEKETSPGKPRKRRQERTLSDRVRTKTLIMFIRTLVFIATLLLYMALNSLLAESDNVLQKMSHPGKAAYFFFYRLYYINHVINPMIYGLLDLKFRKALRKTFSTNRFLAKFKK